MSERKGTKGLELWCRKMTEGYRGVKVENMTTSWRDGLAFCAIIHHFRPDLIEFDKLNKDAIYHNNELAFRVAEHNLGIPALLEPEDMVEYEVPDRLSILTYLSQFYQTFENQRGKSGARIAPKRPQSTPDHGIVSPASTSPPTKVQITIGRNRREPCAKCGFPVFIAERLNVGKLLYHRTCFRCARCSSQLTLANYYETENGEFCCEICPDEERQISKKVSPDSVLTRSLSDEEKTASLQTYSDAPDAYSTHFETALEYTLDGDLKRSSTLTEAESTEFTKARSHFFKSQMENSSESGSEDIPVELPKSKPPPLTEDIPFDIPKPKPPILAKPVALRTDSDNSSFPSDKNDTVILNNSSVSEQTNDRFVTKDNVSSSSRISVRARMKLFENNEDNNKSDVNKFSSSNNQVPLSSVKKKATVVAIDDLEDFDNISRKDIDIENNSSLNSSKNDCSSIKMHSDEVTNESDIKVAKLAHEKADNASKEETNIDLRQNDLFIIKTDHNIDVVNPKNELAAANSELADENIIIIDDSDHEEEGYKTSPKPEISTVTIIDDSDREDEAYKTSPKPEISTITISDDSDHENETYNMSPKPEICNITIDDSDHEAQAAPKPEIENCNTTIEDNSNKTQATPKVAISDDSFMSANSQAATASTDDSFMMMAPKRGYYTAYEVLSPQDDEAKLSGEESLNVDQSFSMNEAINESLIERNTEPSVCENKSVYDISVMAKDSVEEPSTLELKENSHGSISAITADNEEKITDGGADDKETIIDDKDVEVEMQQTPDNSNIEHMTPDRESVVLEQESGDYPDDLNPFGDDDDESVSPSQRSFGVPDDEKVTASTRPVPAARPKKKITANQDVKELTGTPECLARIYLPRISKNPFEEAESEEELESDGNYNPFENDDKEEEPVVIRQKKKIIPRLEDRTIPESPLNASTISTDSPRSYNPFDDVGDEGDTESPGRPVPVPTPRASKAIRPEPKPRDTLSTTSRGSHGGSNSSISSGSAFGSARKKKQAPRPPMPFRNHESSGSSMASPNSSIAQSPNLSGTIRSRKTKRAPPPPNSSTPYNPERLGDRPSKSLGISPINLGHAEALSDDVHKEKNVKDEENRNRQSQIQSIVNNETDSNLGDKSTTGRWKRRKGQAPSRPIPQRRIVKTLPISEIKRELDTIEIQQQGLEKQGVRLEQIIREKCEGVDGANAEDQVPIEVEDLILQLFELVNEKNELFRRQAELMYLRRQQRLEEEYADVEYQIRCLMLQPEANKSDSDKVREETLINRLVEIVERRNEIIECLEMDRRREAEEDNSISSQLNLYSAKRDGDLNSSKEEEKKDKKKKHKKLTKIIHTFKHKKEKDHKVDVDKDVDESELNSSSEKGKKKKFNLFS